MTCPVYHVARANTSHWPKFFSQLVIILASLLSFRRIFFIILVCSQIAFLLAAISKLGRRLPLANYNRDVTEYSWCSLPCQLVLCVSYLLFFVARWPPRLVSPLWQESALWHQLLGIVHCGLSDLLTLTDGELPSHCQRRIWLNQENF